MNLAFPALLVFILVLPGVILRYTYARGPWRWSSPTSIRTITDEIAYSVAFAIGLHLLWVPLAWLLGHVVCNLEPDLYSILVLLTGSYGPDSKFFEPAVASISDHPYAVTFYFLSLYTASAALGYGAHYVVRKSKLDLKDPVLRFRNEWYYLLRGEVLEFDGAQPSKPVAGVALSAVIDQGSESYIYWGIINDFWFDKDGNLDRISLTATHRREFSKDYEDKSGTKPQSASATPLLDDRYYRIRGNYFVIRYSEVKTMNLQYLLRG